MGCVNYLNRFNFAFLSHKATNFSYKYAFGKNSLELVQKYHEFVLKASFFASNSLFMAFILPKVFTKDARPYGLLQISHNSKLLHLTHAQLQTRDRLRTCRNCGGKHWKIRCLSRNLCLIAAPPLKINKKIAKMKQSRNIQTTMCGKR